jgi:hypothetical protein
MMYAFSTCEFLFITGPRLLLSYVIYWSYASGIYYYLCNQCLSSPTWWFRTPLMWGVLDTTLCDKVCQWLATGRRFSSGTALSNTNKTNRHDITEILLNRVNHQCPNPTTKLFGLVVSEEMTCIVLDNKRQNCAWLSFIQQ